DPNPPNTFPATVSAGPILRVCTATYTVTETQPPPGYSNDPVTDHQRTCVIEEPDQACSVTFSDPLGNLTINKVDADTNAALTGAVFTVSPNPFSCYQPSAGTFPATIKDGDALDASGSATDGNLKINRDGNGTNRGKES